MNKKKLLALLMALVMTLSLLPVTAMAENEQDAQDVPAINWDENSITINTAEELSEFATRVNSNNSFAGKTITLGANITLSGTWTPIGNGYYDSNNGGLTGNTFAGTFDGNGKTISGLNVTTTGEQAAGLFGIVNGGTIKNLTVSGATVTSEKRYAGAIVGGLTAGTIENCHVTGAIDITGEHFVGGLAGLSYGTIKGSSVNATGTITGVDGDETKDDGDDVGGLVGFVQTLNGKVQNGDVTAASGGLTISGIRQVGGIAGAIDTSASIDSDSVATGVTVKSTASSDKTNADKDTNTIGIVVGRITAKAINAGTATGSTLEIATKGQLETFRDAVNAGNSFDGNTVKLTADITLSGTWTPIGNGGRGSNYTTTGNYFAGTFNGNGHTISGLNVNDMGTQNDDTRSAGLFGAIKNARIENFTLSAPIVNSNCNNTGAVVGLMNDGTISNVKVTGGGTVSSYEGAGGIVGRVINSGAVTGCENGASVLTTNRSAGGIVGTMYYTDDASKLTISNCTNTGAVSGTQCVGGIVGYNWGNISGNSNSGSVTLIGNGSGNKYAGGIVGEQRHGGTIESNTNSGTVSGGTGGLGGIVGGVDYQTPPANVATVTISGNTATAGSPATILGTTGTLPSGVSAPALSGNNPSTQDNANVAKIGDQGYATLAAAIAAAQSTDTITLLADVTITDYTVLADNKTYSIDLAGYTIDDPDDNLYFYGTNITIKDSTGKGAFNAPFGLKVYGGSVTVEAGTITGTNYGAYVENGQLTVKGGTISAPGSQYYAIYAGRNYPDDNPNVSLEGGTVIIPEGKYGVYVANGASLTVSDNAVISGPGKAISTNGNNTGANITISGGTLNSDGYVAVFLPSGQLTVSGGTITGATGIYQKSGTMEITGGTITGNGTAAEYTYNGNGANPTGDAIVIDNCGYPGGEPTASITGGIFVSENAAAVGSYCDGNKATAAVTNFISGGTFNSCPDEAYLAEGYMAKNNGNETWTVQLSDEIDHTNPTWQWRVIGGEMKAVSTYTSPSGKTEIVITEPDGITENESVRTYSATDKYENDAPTYEQTINYSVSLNGSQLGTVYKWGDICTLNCDALSKWLIGENVVADGTRTYTFAVTGNTLVTTEGTDSTTQQPVVSATLTATSNTTAAFQAKWTIPAGATVTKVTIYRGFTSNENSSISYETLKAHGKAFNADLKVLNGDYLLKLTGLTTNKWQHAVIEIKYTINNVEQEPLVSSVKHTQITVN